MKRFKWGDVLAFLTAALIVGYLSFNIYDDAGGEPMLYVESADQKWLYPLDDHQDYSFPGELGKTVVHVGEDGVDVLDSPCRDKVCVHAAPLKNPGDWTACLPNNIFIQIIGDEREEGALDDLGF